MVTSITENKRREQTPVRPLANPSATPSTSSTQPFNSSLERGKGMNGPQYTPTNTFVHNGNVYTIPPVYSNTLLQPLNTNYINNSIQQSISLTGRGTMPTYSPNQQNALPFPQYSNSMSNIVPSSYTVGQPSKPLQTTPTASHSSPLSTTNNNNSTKEYGGADSTQPETNEKPLSNKDHPSNEERSPSLSQPQKNPDNHLQDTHNSPINPSVNNEHMNEDAPMKNNAGSHEYYHLDSSFSSMPLPDTNFAPFPPPEGLPSLNRRDSILSTSNLSITSLLQMAPLSPTKNQEYESSEPPSQALAQHLDLNAAMPPSEINSIQNNFASQNVNELSSPDVYPIIQSHLSVSTISDPNVEDDNMDDLIDLYTSNYLDEILNIHSDDSGPNASTEEINNEVNLYKVQITNTLYNPDVIINTTPLVYHGFTQILPSLDTTQGLYYFYKDYIDELIAANEDAEFTSMEGQDYSEGFNQTAFDPVVLQEITSTISNANNTVQSIMMNQANSSSNFDFYQPSDSVDVQQGNLKHLPPVDEFDFTTNQSVNQPSMDRKQIPPANVPKGKIVYHISTDSILCHSDDEEDIIIVDNSRTLDGRTASNVNSKATSSLVPLDEFVYRAVGYRSIPEDGEVVSASIVPSGYSNLLRPPRGRPRLSSIFTNQSQPDVTAPIIEQVDNLSMNESNNLTSIAEGSKEPSVNQNSMPMSLPSELENTEIQEVEVPSTTNENQDEPMVVETEITNDVPAQEESKSNASKSAAESTSNQSPDDVQADTETKEDASKPASPPPSTAEASTITPPSTTQAPLSDMGSLSARMRASSLLSESHFENLLISTTQHSLMDPRSTPTLSSSFLYPQYNYDNDLESSEDLLSASPLEEEHDNSSEKRSAVFRHTESERVESTWTENELDRLQELYFFEEVTIPKIAKGMLFLMSLSLVFYKKTYQSIAEQLKDIKKREV